MTSQKQSYNFLMKTNHSLVDWNTKRFDHRVLLLLVIGYFYNCNFALSDPSMRQDLPQLFDDHLTATVANCFSGPQTDEGIQVQVLKALLSIVTSGKTFILLEYRNV